MENQEKLLQFVEWLGQNVPELKGQGPEQIVSTINELSKSDEGKQMLQGLIQEFESSMTGMFKKGGKLDYLLCLKSGGNIQDCGCGKKMKNPLKAQDGLDELPHESRRDALNAARDRWDISRAQARFGYRNQKQVAKKRGFKGKEMRQIARNNMINSAYPKAVGQTISPVDISSLKEDLNIVDKPIVMQDVPIDLPEFVPPTPDRFGGNFNTAFSTARKLGLDKFYYDDPNKENSGWKTTKLGTGTNTETNTGTIGKNQQRSETNQDLIANEVKSAQEAPTFFSKMWKAFNAGVMANNLSTGII